MTAPPPYVTILYIGVVLLSIAFLCFRYNRAKGFFCATFPNGSFRCLGKSKGRRYGSMSEESYQFLSDYYRVLNLRLADQMTALKKPLPRWLQREIKDKNNS